MVTTDFGYVHLVHMCANHKLSLPEFTGKVKEEWQDVEEHLDLKAIDEEVETEDQTWFAGRRGSFHPPWWSFYKIEQPRGCIKHYKTLFLYTPESHLVWFGLCGTQVHIF